MEITLAVGSSVFVAMAIGLLRAMFKRDDGHGVKRREVRIEREKAAPRKPRAVGCDSVIWFPPDGPAPQHAPLGFAEAAGGPVPRVEVEIPLSNYGSESLSRTLEVMNANPPMQLNPSHHTQKELIAMNLEQMRLTNEHMKKLLSKGDKP